MKSVIIASIVGIVLAGCEERVVQPMVIACRPEGSATATATAPPPGATAPPSTTPSTSASATATAPPHTIPPPKCEGRCCPTTPSCYAPLNNPSMYSGAECLARRDNTDQPHRQLRQTMSISVNPPGLAAVPIATVLMRRSELKSAMCGAPTAFGTFIQLIDLDTKARTSRTGFAKFAPDLDTAVASGLCFVEEPAYRDPMHALPTLYAPTADWPRGLPAPMPMPWNVGPTTAVRVDNDFDVAKERVAILARFDVGGDLNGKAGGIFYLDDATGRMHGFSPLTYIVNYDDMSTYVVVPIREAEITQQLNDPKHPNCSGSFVGDDAMLLPPDCTGGPTVRAWGCPAGNCAANEPAPTRIDGYFLLAELEQVFALGQTLCNLFAGGTGYPGWTIPADNQACRADPKWNPTDPVHGLPHGDWCAAGNHPSDDNCHDALKSTSYSTFQAFPIRDGTCSPL